jgi:GST-like protein
LRRSRTARERPATVRAYARADELKQAPVNEEEMRKVLYGQDASTVRR